MDARLKDFKMPDNFKLTEDQNKLEIRDTFAGKPFEKNISQQPNVR